MSERQQPAQPHHQSRWFSAAATSTTQAKSIRARSKVNE